MKQPRVEVARFDRSVVKKTAPFSYTANMRDEAVKNADRLNAQLPTSVRREDAYRLELAAVKEEMGITAPSAPSCGGQSAI